MRGRARSAAAGGPSSRIRPSWKNAIRSATSRAKPISWVTTIIVMCSSVESVFITDEHLAGELGVERRGRLVEEHDVGLHRQRPGDGDALLLAAGEPDGVLAGLVGQADPVEEVLGPLGDLGSVPAPGAPRRAR